jgi:death-on-curing protein
LGSRYVEWIHDVLIGSLWADVDPVSRNEYRDIDLLESALGRPFHSAGGQDAYPSVIDKASALFHSLISNHPFHNGNKRTAVIAVDAFLMGNGYSLALNNTKMYELAQKTASYRARGKSHEEAFREIKETLTKFTVPLTTLYREQRKNKNLAGLYKSVKAIRNSVRRNPANQHI